MLTVEEPAVSPNLPIDVPNDNVPRMVMSKMVLENFKSYAGVKEIGPFHKVF